MPIVRTVFGASLLLLVPSVANAACVLTGARPTVPLPTMTRGQEFSFLASSGCEMLRFSIRGTTLEKIPRSGLPTGPGLHTYKVRLTEDEWDAVVAGDTLTWIVSGRSGTGEVTRLVTTNEIAADGGIEIDLSLADAKLVGEEPDDSAGFDAAAAGDVNGDGYDDLFLGAPANDAGGDNAGAAYLVSGPVTGRFDLSRSNAVLVGETTNDLVGEALAGAGDVNADGYDDLIVGSRLHNAREGIAYLALGPVSGTRDLSLADASLLGELSGSQTGYDVSGAGDTDGDGYDDVLVSTGLTPPGPGHRFVYVVRGPVTGAFDLGFADAVVEIDAGSTFDDTYVAEAGDVNGDGLGDLLIGSPYDSEVADGAGAAYLAYGPVSGTGGAPLWDAKLLGEEVGDLAGRGIAGGGDVDGDGNDDLLIGAWGNDRGGDSAGAAYLVLGPVHGTRDVARAADATLLGTNAGAAEHAGGYMVSIAGDVDLDGRADMLIGAPYNSQVFLFAGAAYLVLSPVGGTVDLSTADVTFRAEARLDFAGVAGGFAGDVDADGRADVLLGAPGNDRHDGRRDDSGAAYVLYGAGL